MTESQARNIALLFVKFQTLWREKWTRDITSEAYEAELKETWVSALRGLSGRQIETAIDECRKNYSWPVTPADFRCLAIGAPNHTAAWQAVLKNDFSNPYVKFAYDKVGSWDIKHRDEKTARQKFMSDYSECTKNNQLQESIFKAISSSEKDEPLSLGSGDGFNATQELTESNRAISDVLRKLYCQDLEEPIKKDELTVQNLNSKEIFDCSDEETKKKYLLSLSLADANKLSKEDNLIWWQLDGERRSHQEFLRMRK